MPRPWLRPAAGLALGAAGIAGCTEWSDRIDSRVATAGMPSALEDLEAFEWVLADDEQAATLVFEGDHDEDDRGVLHGQAPCNSFRGDFTLDGEGGIEVGQVATTRALCPDRVMRAEEVFLLFLADAGSVDLADDADHLTLTTPAGAELRFTALDPD
jgi:heat shock protein HslJ